jgi:DNA replication protein DnaC
MNMLTSQNAGSTAKPMRVCQGVKARDGFPALDCSTPVALALYCDLCIQEHARRDEQILLRADAVLRHKAMLAADIPLAFIDGRKSLATLRDLSPAHRMLKRACEALVQWQPVHGCRRNVLARGGPGIGKTHAALATAAAFCERTGGTASAALVWNVARLTKKLQAAAAPNSGTSPDAITERASTVRLLVLDDLGATRLTRFALDCIYSILEARSQNELATIGTTNYTTLADLAVRLIPSDGGDLQDAHRVIDRVEELLPIMLDLRGDSQRSKVNREVQDD